MGRFLRRIQYFLRQRRAEADLREELEFHRAETERRLARAGMGTCEAADASRRALGNSTLAREDARAVWIGPWLESVWQDVRVGVRMLRRSPGTTAIAIVTMALGIGANTAVYSLIDAALFRPLPVRDPERLVFFTETTPAGLRSARDFTMRTYERLRDGAHTLAGLAAYDSSRVSATIDGEPEMVLGDFVSGNYFDVLGAAASIGRTLSPADDRPDSPAVVVLSDPYWQRRFAGDPAVVGRQMAFGGTPLTIVGVMPPAFHGRNVTGRAADVILPLPAHAGLALRDHTTFGLVGRLKPSVTRERASAELDAIYQQALAGEPAAAAIDDDPRTRLSVSPGMRGESGGLLGPDDRRQVMTVMAIVGLTLLIGCVNVANLLLARAASRRREIAVRLSIGAGRFRLMRQLLTESVLLAATGGAAGLLVARWGTGVLQNVMPLGQVTLDPARDSAALAFTGVIVVATGLLFGLAPAAAASRVDCHAMLRGDAGRSGGHWSRHAGTTLVVAQVALSVTLLVATGLLVHSLQRLYRVDTGLDADRVLVAGVYPALLRYDHARELELYRTLTVALRDTPGIEGIGLARYDIGRGRLNFVSPGLFATLGVPVIRGRDLTEADVASAAPHAVVSETAARQFYPGEDSIGRVVPERVAREFGGPLEIVGVVPDIRTTYRRGEPRPAVYLPYTLAPSERLGQIDLFVRTAGRSAQAAAAVRAAARRIEPDLALLNLQLLASELDRSVGDHRSTAALLGACGLLALLLVTVGLYGTMSKAVVRRTKELGIRISLGAARSDVLFMILRESAAMVGCGFAIGLPIALLAARGLSRLLFGVGAADPASIAAALLLMTLVGLVAGYLPARRASRVDPVIALRHE